MSLKKEYLQLNVDIVVFHNLFQGFDGCVFIFNDLSLICDY